jgi:predicted DNA-binding WGR domain protein
MPLHGAASMTAIHLIRIDPEKNMARFYKLDVQPNLFGQWSIVREWGRIGRAGTIRVETHESRGGADMALISKWAMKRKWDYR